MATAAVAGASLILPQAQAFGQPLNHDADMIVDSETGPVAGSRSSGVTSFLGIPYAAAPVGDLRFRSPRPHPRWISIRPAVQRAPSSIQTITGVTGWIYDSSSVLPTSEDCLYLNVWTPSTKGRRPVLVFIHGGSERTGSGTVSCISGQHLARLGDIVVVTFNYRLGSLGMLSHPSLRDPETGLAGNWGMQDQIAALTWVKRNISRFGGDPERVTLGGQSSSAGDVRNLMTQRSYGSLYDQVILSSFKLQKANTPDEGAAYTELVAQRLRISVAALRRVDANALHGAELALSSDLSARNSIGGVGLAPIVDGVTVQYPSYFDHDRQDIPVLLGTNRNEQFLIYNLIGPDGAMVSTTPPPSNPADLYAQIASELAAGYPPSSGAAPDPVKIAEVFSQSMRRRGEAAGPADAFMEFDTDLVRRGPAAQFAAQHSATADGPAYVYELDQPLRPPGVGVPHCADLPFVFGTYAVPFLAARVGDSRRIATVSQAMMRAWSNFVKTGDPRSSGTETWQPYRYQQRSVATFGGDAVVDVVENPRSEQLKIFKSFYEGP